MFWSLGLFFVRLHCTATFSGKQNVLYIKSTQLTGVRVLDACWQILVSIQVDGDKRSVFALDVTGFTGLDSVKLVLPPQTCQHREHLSYIIAPVKTSHLSSLSHSRLTVLDLDLLLCQVFKVVYDGTSGQVVKGLVPQLLVDLLLTLAATQVGSDIEEHLPFCRFSTQEPRDHDLTVTFGLTC